MHSQPMPTIIEGDLSSAHVRIGIVVSRFNSFITEKLLNGALDAFRRHGVEDENLTVAWCPGSFEIPVVARRMAESGNFDAIACLGAIIRGATSHYDLVAAEVARGVGQVSAQVGVPVIFGVITTDTIEQAIERAGAKSGNKGAEAAVSALEMANLMSRLK